MLLACTFHQHCSGSAVFRCHSLQVFQLLVCVQARSLFVCLFVSRSLVCLLLMENPNPDACFSKSTSAGVLGCTELLLCHGLLVTMNNLTTCHTECGSVIRCVSLCQLRTQ